MLTIEELKTNLYYDHVTGDFIWRTAGRGRKIGDKAGTISKGYISIGINKERYKAHRLAWFYVHEQWPKSGLDHINLCKTDNRIINLREATISQNASNRNLNSKNTTGYKGVSVIKSTGKFAAFCSVNSKNKNLGSFDTAEEAAMVFNKFSKSIRGEFHREASF